MTALSFVWVHPYSQNSRCDIYKALHGKIRPGGTQYQTLKKEESKIKIEPSDVPVQSLKGKGRGKTSQKT